MEVYTEHEYQFQFHKGTIKTPISGAMPGSCRSFNSIKVRLKLCLVCYLSFPPSRFNSIKVRLKLTVLLIVLRLCLLFQFHKGTIKTKEFLKKIGYLESFNSIKVRLKLCKDGWKNVENPFQFHKGTIKTCCQYPPFPQG